MSNFEFLANALSSSAKQGWLVGRLHAAKDIIQTVLDEARDNIERCPDDKPTAEALIRLEGVIQEIDKVAKPLYVAATGGKIND